MTRPTPHQRNTRLTKRLRNNGWLSVLITSGRPNSPMANSKQPKNVQRLNHRTRRSITLSRGRHLSGSIKSERPSIQVTARSRSSASDRPAKAGPVHQGPICAPLAQPHDLRRTRQCPPAPYAKRRGRPQRGRHQLCLRQAETPEHADTSTTVNTYYYNESGNIEEVGTSYAVDTYQYDALGRRVRVTSTIDPSASEASVLPNVVKRDEPRNYIARPSFNYPDWIN